MILSASRRTDIPAFYADWFINRLKAGYVLVRNPFNANHVSKIFLNPEIIECIVFWTKNPSSLMKRLHEIDKLGYKYYFQFTITSYNQNIERNIPNKKKIIKTFQELSNKIGREKVVWRYDPILLTTGYSVDYHRKWFSCLAENLSGYTNRCVLSFINMYKKCEKNMKKIPLKSIDDNIKKQLSTSFSKTANSFGISVESCAEVPLLSNSGVKPGKCVDDQLISEIIGKQIEIRKDKSQRHDCRCVTSIDIGSYNTCRHGCKYCYANYSEKTVAKNCNTHEVSSHLIYGNLNGNEKISERKNIL